MIRLFIRLVREERGDMQFLYVTLALFAALAVAAGEGLADSVSSWVKVVGRFIGL